MVTLAIYKRMRKWLFGNCERSILECEQRGVRSSQGCKEAVIENLASRTMKSKHKKTIVELYYDFQKAYNNVNHAFWKNSFTSIASRLASMTSSSR